MAAPVPPTSSLQVAAAAEEALKCIKKNDSLRDLGIFLENFQKNINKGLDFVKGKITDPSKGLEMRISSLEAAVNGTDQSTGGVDRVSTIENSLTNDVGVSRIELLEKAVASGTLVAGADNSTLVTRLNMKTNDLEK